MNNVNKQNEYCKLYEYILYAQIKPLPQDISETGIE